MIIARFVTLSSLCGPRETASVKIRDTTKSGNAKHKFSCITSLDRLLQQRLNTEKKLKNVNELLCLESLLIYKPKKTSKKLKERFGVYRG